LSQADGVWLTEVYAAGESPIVAADGRSLVRALRVEGVEDLHFCPDIQTLAEQIQAQAQPGDVILCLGAGSIGQVPQLIKNGVLA
jgi:UDP-N-acetylmuramate--alanine ligase